MAKLDLARLKALAEKATPGPWEYDKRHGIVREYRRQTDGAFVTDWLVTAETNAQFMAACSPDVILSLIARLEKIEQWATDVNQPSGGYAVAQAEVLRLLREEENK